MNIPGNGRAGLAGLTLAGMAAIWWGSSAGGMLNINTRGEQVLAFVPSVWRWYLFLPSCNVPPCEGEFISPAVAAGQRLTRRRRRVALTPPIILRWGNSPTLRYQYGRAWSCKVRILLIGSVRDVEQLTPKLTQELWQEDQVHYCCGVETLGQR